VANKTAVYSPQTLKAVTEKWNKPTADDITIAATTVATTATTTATATAAAAAAIGKWNNTYNYLIFILHES
jgi:hypothetical protein